VKTGRFVQLPPDVLDLLGRLAEARGTSPDAVLEAEVRRAALEAGLVPPQVDPFLVIESVDETPAIGPEGRGRRVRLKAIDETGEQDIGTLFVPIDPRERP
jgi:hypothetical protein